MKIAVNNLAIGGMLLPETKRPRGNGAEGGCAVIAEAINLQGDVAAVLPVVAVPFDEGRFRRALGDGFVACERGVWGDVWGAYGRVRVAGGNAEALPVGIEDYLGRVLVAGEGYSVAFSHLHVYVFAALCRESVDRLRSGAAFVATDRLMRGALQGYVRQLQADADKLARRRDDETDAAKRETLVAVVAHCRAERERWGAILASCWAENWIEAEDGRRIKLHLDTDLDDHGRGVTVGVLADDCPVCHGTTAVTFEADGFQDEDARVSCKNCGTTWDVQGRAL